MMGTTPCDFCKLLSAANLLFQSIALLLSALVLPVGRPVPRKSRFELTDKGIVVLEILQATLCFFIPKHTSVLLAGTTDALDAVHGDRHGLAEAIQDEVEGLEPHRNRSKDLARFLVDTDALVDVVSLAEVGIEVDLSLGHGLEVRADDDGFGC